MARYVSRTADYVVLDPEGQDLPTIAGDWTLDPGYALAIANYNMLDPGQAAPGMALPPGETVAIPVNWVKPTILAAVQRAPAGGVAGGQNWWLYGALALFAAALLS